MRPNVGGRLGRAADVFTPQPHICGAGRREEGLAVRLWLGGWAASAHGIGAAGKLLGLVNCFSAPSWQLGRAKLESWDWSQARLGHWMQREVGSVGRSGLRLADLDSWQHEASLHGCYPAGAHPNPSHLDATSGLFCLCNSL